MIPYEVIKNALEFEDSCLFSTTVSFMRGIIFNKSASIGRSWIMVLPRIFFLSSKPSSTKYGVLEPPTVLNRTLISCSACQTRLNTNIKYSDQMFLTFPGLSFDVALWWKLCDIKNGTRDLSWKSSHDSRSVGFFIRLNRILHFMQWFAV